MWDTDVGEGVKGVAYGSVLDYWEIPCPELAGSDVALLKYK